MKLAPEAVSAGMSLSVFDAIGSTNDAALDSVQQGAAAHWVVAREQTAGRGRSGRVWSSPPGNLYASLALANPCEPARAAQLGFVAGLALHRAVTDVTGLTADRLMIKWPNDLVLDRAKVAGLLVEGSIGGNGQSVAVIGMGVNCRAHPADTPYAATDLATAGAGVTADMLFERLSSRMAETLDLWQRGEGFALVRQAWLARAAGRGETIRVRQGDGAREGIFRDIDSEGRLLLEGASGVETILAGDVFFLPVKGQPV